MRKRLNAAVARPRLWWRERRLRTARRDLFRGAIISLTTVPSRVGLLPHVIGSLLHQTVSADRIVLYAGFHDDRVAKLAVRHADRFEVRFVENDLGSYRKLVHALGDFSDSAIVTCDDDCLYPTDFVERLRAAAADRPDAVLCGRARRMAVAADGRFAHYRAWSPVEDEASASYWLCPTGVGGVLYPRGGLAPEATDARLFRDLAPTVDDIWFKAMTLRRGLPARCVGGIWAGIRELPVVRACTLARINRDGGNDCAVERVFGHFGIDPASVARLEAGLTRP